MDYKEKVIALLNSQELSKEQKEKLEEIFPELKESEDEKLRKWCISHFRGCFRITKDNAEFKEYINNKVIPWLEKQGEQKPAWSEEDEKIINGITSYLCTHDSCELDGFDKWYDFLKSLKYRVLPQPKHEWGEEEEEIYRNIFNHYFTIEEPTDGNGIPKEKYLNLIKSLRPQSQWKPSEELLDVFIKNAIDFFESNFNPLTDGGVIGAFDDKEKMIEEFKEYMKEEGFNEEWI